MSNQTLKHKPMIAPIVFGIIDKPSSSQVSKNNSYIALSVVYRPAFLFGGNAGLWMLGIT